MTVTSPEALRTAGLPLTGQPDPLVLATVSGAHEAETARPHTVLDEAGAASARAAPHDLVVRARPAA